MASADADEAPLLAEEPLRPGACSRELELREFRDRYVIRSLDGGAAFAVARSGGSIRPLSQEEAAARSDCKVSKIYGVVGIIRLLAGSYVLVITSQKDVGCYQGSPKRDEAYFMSLLRIAETTCGLYYSYDRDLTLKMWRRGANLEGATANFVETEQLVEYEGLTSSFIQVRGSIPLLWEQIVDLSYKPRLSIIEHEETAKVVQRHFHDLSQRYGETVVIDLTDKQGDEGDLSNAFAAEMGRIPGVRYMHFDFHHVCCGGNFDNLQVLYNQIAAAIQKQGYFLMNSKGEILLEQSGVVRSNCIDCLDRTNVTQSFLARKSLDSQLQQMGALSSSESISISDNINDIFKKLWVEHGDELSLEYAGSYALKGDLVRYGRQTLPGLLKDGMSALSRYYLNNFHDGVRQDALDLISGYYTVSQGSSSPFHTGGFESASYLPVASAIIVGGITATTFTLSQDDINVDDEAPSKPAPPSTSTMNNKTKTKTAFPIFSPRDDLPDSTFLRRTLQDAAAAAAAAKQKLMERQEKLARITEQSAELESEAENFATLAQQIRKNTENKWWKR
ncbi:Phosphoinositide phosphatase SAC8 [Dichanthelium oligosanthes]|uniref:Phosphoinositide phosphatase SAC8 n=1 Tax=Dichanthelium oligosanthes TaxID=888268 RepID=A0A1E5VQ76_9POAL|nr:Phosphoinositide phosphatase SAC8 [Dichanthelium oligosanthes]